MKKKFSGVVVPMVTPVTKEKKIDKEAVRKIMASFSHNNIHPLVLGTTGESSSVSAEESVVLLKTALECKAENQLVYAGIVGNQVEELTERAKLYLSLGADAIVATLPAYYVLTPVQMKNFYLHLADSITGPLFIYNIKATTQMSIPLDIIEELSFHPNIAGLKDSERDLERLENCISKYKDREDFAYFCGWGGQSYYSLKMGADGIVPSTGNFAQEMYKQMMDAAEAGNWELCEKMQQDTDEIAAKYQAGRTLGESLAVLKQMMKTKNLCEHWMLPPLSEVEL